MKFTTSVSKAEVRGSHDRRDILRVNTPEDRNRAVEIARTRLLDTWPNAPIGRLELVEFIEFSAGDTSCGRITLEVADR